MLFERAGIQIHPGQKIGLTGANGTGKSSLFALIQGELHADAGELRYPGDWVIASVAQETPADHRCALEYVLDGDAELRSIETGIVEAEREGDGERLAVLHGQFESIGGYQARSRAGQLLHGLGFASGDEAIRMPARIVTNVVNKASNSEGFVGHIGGDDFFFIVPAHLAQQCCAQIIENFDLVITTLIDDEDRARGFIESKDRQGNPQRFPMLSASIGVIDLTITSIDHPGRASAIAGELKKAVKKREGSNFMVNRRKSLKV